ncbi:hypothetical protein AGLY_016917 [Aphis glycines]|uniref:Uncharacterized protein n=1 Tax=Aphis glycines TaxID=307491 RepID=A0A6G0SX74_APHGL|nr:hypothetical protein AGLY_016917 [Aphis glycines]
MHLRCYCTFSNSCPNLQQQRQGHLVSLRRRQLDVNKRRTTVYKGARRPATADVPKLSTTKHFHDTRPLILLRGERVFVKRRLYCSKHSGILHSFFRRQQCIHKWYSNCVMNIDMMFTCSQNRKNLHENIGTHLMSSDIDQEEYPSHKVFSGLGIDLERHQIVQPSLCVYVLPLTGNLDHNHDGDYYSWLFNIFGHCSVALKLQSDDGDNDTNLTMNYLLLNYY